MFQNFFSPQIADLEPRVQFAKAAEQIDSGWYLIAGPKGAGAPLEIRQQIRVYDVHGQAGDFYKVIGIAGVTPWLYVMDGKAQVDAYSLEKGDSITGELEELVLVELLADTTLVLFLVSLKASMKFTGILWTTEMVQENYRKCSFD